MESRPVLCLKDRHEAVVFFEPAREVEGLGGFWFFAVRAGDQVIANGGQDGELPSVTALVEASRHWIDWDRDSDALRDCKADELTYFSPETQRIMERV